MESSGFITYLKTAIINCTSVEADTSMLWSETIGIFLSAKY